MVRHDVAEGCEGYRGVFVGTKYMVVDCGGGTVDITVHAMDSEKGCLQELYKASGGPYGSVSVDIAFETLLESIFGADFIAQYKVMSCYFTTFANEK